jgi:hypothetical protein
MALGAGEDELKMSVSDWLYIASWATSLAGLACFSTKFPEKFYPGKFIIFVSFPINLNLH